MDYTVVATTIGGRSRGLAGFMRVYGHVKRNSKWYSTGPHRHRGHISLIRKAVWLIRWEERRCPKTNKRIRRTEESLRERRRRRARADDRAQADRCRSAGSTGALDLWRLAERARRNWCKELSPRTVHGYRAVIKTYVPKHLLRRKLQDLSPSDLQELFNDMSQRGFRRRPYEGFVRC